MALTAMRKFLGGLGVWWRRCYAALAGLLTLAVFLAMLVPLRPSFPDGTGLDHSWTIGLNEGIARGLRIGTDLVFTFGPYASVSTGEYHAGTDALTLLGSAVLALCYSLSIFALSRWRGRYLAPLVAFAMLAILGRRSDAILLAYPLAFAIFVYLRYLATQWPRPQDRRLDRVVLAVLLLPFGLLPLVKASSAAGCVAIGAICCAALLARRRWNEALAVAVVPAVAGLVLWLIAGQPPGSLGAFASNSLEVVSGYAGAMASTGPAPEIAAYLIASALLLVALLANPRETRMNRAFLGAALGVYLFLGLKSGFVRHDEPHIMSGASVLAMSVLLLLFLRLPLAPLAVMGGLGAWLYLDAQHHRIASDAIVADARNPFYAFGTGWAMRVGDGKGLPALAAQARERLARDCSIGKLQGAVDIYSFQQACLILSGNRWSPRPVFQSYAAYTPKLAELNARHLLAAAAPAHILFRVEPIDLRFPSLEDGPSWPLLFSLYAPRRLDGDLLYLERREGAQAALEPAYGAPQRLRIGAEVPLPSGPGLLMAKVELRPTFFGRLMSALFKVPVPAIEVKGDNGAARQARFVPGMGAAGFLISPFVESTRDFALVGAGNDRFVRQNRLLAMKIEIPEGGERYWSGTYSARFARLPLPVADTAVERTIFDQPLASAPAAGAVASTGICDGNLDTVNDATPVPMRVRTGPVVTLRGWLAVSAKTGELADEVYVAVRRGDEPPLYYRTRSTLRSDLPAFYDQPGLLRAGFESFLDLGAVASGADATLYLAQLAHGKLMQCEPLRSIRVVQ